MRGKEPRTIPRDEVMCMCVCSDHDVTLYVYVLYLSCIVNHTASYMCTRVDGVKNRDRNLRNGKR